MKTAIFLLRIEDTDQERFVEGALEIIYRTLEKTGLIHDEGPDKTAESVHMCKAKTTDGIVSEICKSS